MRTKMLVFAAASVLVVAPGSTPAAESRCDEPLREVYRTDSAYSFDSIDVISPDDVWATGESERAFFVHWDGAIWSEVPAPEPSGTRYVMKAVSGVTTDDVWAVGSDTFTDRHVVLHWDGSGWSVSETPSIGKESSLQDVVALDDGTAYAVGHYRPRNARGIRPLVLRTDGVTWVREPVGLQQPRFGLSDVDAHVAENLWATPLGKPFALVRGPEGWSKLPLPREAALRDVAVTPAGSAWLVAEGGGRKRSPLVWRYAAGAWERSDVPDRRYPEYLYAVAALSDSEVWVAGLRITGDRAFPYAARLTDTGFVHVPAEDPGWLAIWDLDLDQSGGAWAGGEAGPAMIQRAC